MSDFRQQTVALPTSSRDRLWQDSVVFQLSPFGDNIDLDYIVSIKQKSAGNATKAMQWLCELADTHAVSLRLNVQPKKSAGAEGRSLSAVELRRFYAKFHFKKTFGDEMLRQPE